MAALAVVSRRLAIPYPIVMTIAGLLPEIFFPLFLPPILFSAAFLTSPREPRASAQPIALLAIGLVLATTVVV